MHQRAVRPLDERMRRPLEPMEGLEEGRQRWEGEERLETEGRPRVDVLRDHLMPAQERGERDDAPAREGIHDEERRAERRLCARQHAIIDGQSPSRPPAVRAHRGEVALALSRLPTRRLAQRSDMRRIPSLKEATGPRLPVEGWGQLELGAATRAHAVVSAPRLSA